MRHLLSKNILLVFLIVAMALTYGRLGANRLDLSAFIVAGSDFTDAARTPAPVIVHPGQGYDGQFFYRYALHPLNFSNDQYGVHTDHPAYRMQRIGYPALAWLLSAGGRPDAVPFALVLVNILAFAGIALYTGKLVPLLGGRKEQGLYPLFICGIYMCMARDLAEVTELFFFTGAVYYLFKPRYGLYALFATFTILCRETSVIALAPLTACIVLQAARKEVSWSKLFYFAVPFVVFAVWKGIIYSQIPSLADASAGYGSLGIPFKGIVHGFAQNLNLSTTTGKLQLSFWLMYLCWQVAFVVVIFSRVSFRGLSPYGRNGILRIIYLVWLLFAICFTDNIYCDDWGFVRVFTLWNMVGFLLMIADRKKTGSVFNVASAVMVVLTLVRMIVRA